VGGIAQKGGGASAELNEDETNEATKRGAAGKEIRAEGVIKGNSEKTLRRTFVTEKGVAEGP